MKTMTLTEFEGFLGHNDWKRNQEIEYLDTHTHVEEFYDYDDQDEPTIIEKISVEYEARLVSKLDDVTIEYVERCSYLEEDEESFESYLDDYHGFTVEGIQLVDEDGDELDPIDFVTDDFSLIDYTTILRKIKTTKDIDMTNDKIATITLEIDNAPDLRFNGELIARVSSSDNNASGSSYSGQVGRWTELALYKTVSGKFVCHQIGRTRWQGERDRYSGCVCETIEEVKEFFGHRWLAKELYSDAGIDDVVEVS